MSSKNTETKAKNVSKNKKKKRVSIFRVIILVFLSFFAHLQENKPQHLQKFLKFLMTQHLHQIFLVHLQQQLCIV